MRKQRNGSTTQEEEHRAARRKKSKRQEEEEETGSEDDSSGADRESYRSKRKGRRQHSSKREHRRRSRSTGREFEYSASSDSCSESDTEESGSRFESETSKSEDEARRRRRREKRKRQEREYEERKRRKEDRRKRRKMEKEEKRKKRKDKKKEKEAAKKGAVTNSWGKYGIIKEVDMWNKRPEFTAWLAEVKQVNLEMLSNWEEKQMFKEFMEDHNTATFPSKKYYNLDAYHRRKMEKEMKKGPQKVQEIERSVFNDEEQRRIELLRERERQKEEQVEALKRSMQGGMAQAMKEQSRLKEEMMYQYKLGNYETAAAIQRRLDPDVAM